MKQSDGGAADGRRFRSCTARDGRGIGRRTREAHARTGAKAGAARRQLRARGGGRTTHRRRPRRVARRVPRVPRHPSAAAVESERRPSRRRSTSGGCGRHEELLQPRHDRSWQRGGASSGPAADRSTRWRPASGRPRWSQRSSDSRSSRSCASSLRSCPRLHSTSTACGSARRAAWSKRSRVPRRLDRRPCVCTRCSPGRFRRRAGRSATVGSRRRE